MSGDSPVEGRSGVARVEAFSDGVLAIIITIMVLELHAPEVPGLAALWHLWPTFVAYVLSYAYVAIYWVNHHRLFAMARVVTNGLLWWNIALLFALSLLPFSTAYLGKHAFDPGATALYAASLLLPSLAYAFLQAEIARSGAQGAQGAQAIRYHRATRRKGYAAASLYALAIPLGWYAPAIGVSIAAVVAVLWIKPWSRIDSLFLRCEAPEGDKA